MPTYDYFASPVAPTNGASVDVTLVTDNQAYEQRLRDTLARHAGLTVERVRTEDGTPDPASILRQVDEKGTGVVALGPLSDVTSMLSAAAVLDQTRPDVGVVLIAGREDVNWEHVLRAGIRDLVAPDASDADVVEAFEHAVEVARRRREQLNGGRTESAARIITVVSPKGGSGKTALSTNLGMALAEEHPNQIALVDLDLQFGDLECAFGVTPEETLLGAASANGSLDAMALKAFLTPHPDGCYILCAPASPAEGEMVPAAQIGRILTLLAQEFPYVLVDTSAGLSEHTLAALEVSTDVIFLCAMDVSSVRSLEKEMHALEQLGLTRHRRHFVVNRADARVGMDTSDVEAAVGLPIDVAIPSSRSVPLSMNQGVPLLASDSRSPVARQFRELAGRFVDEDTSDDGLLSWFRRGR